MRCTQALITPPCLPKRSVGEAQSFRFRSLVNLSVHSCFCSAQRPSRFPTGEYLDPYEKEAELRFPFCIAMKDVCDEGLLSSARPSQVIALKQAVQRALAIRSDKKVSGL